jgi:hypothetical protein
MVPAIVVAFPLVGLLGGGIVVFGASRFTDIADTDPQALAVVPGGYMFLGLICSALFALISAVRTLTNWRGISVVERLCGGGPFLIIAIFVGALAIY